MYELILLTKAGREIVVGSGQTDADRQQLAQAAEGLLSGLKKAEEDGHFIKVEAQGGLIHWVMPTEVEGMSVYNDAANPAPSKYELVLLTKGGREIVVGNGQTDDDRQQLAQAAEGLLGGLKHAHDNGQFIRVESQDGLMHWVMPTEVEGMNVYPVED
jgi:hypothetical protein